MRHTLRRAGMLVALACAAAGSIVSGAAAQSTVIWDTNITLPAAKRIRYGHIHGDGITMGPWSYYAAGEEIRIVVAIDDIPGETPPPDSPDPDAPAPDVPGPDPILPEWFPASELRVETSSGVGRAMDTIDGVGGVLTIASQADADAFVEALSSRSLSGADEANRVVVTTAPGVKITENVAMRDGSDLLKHVVFSRVVFKPTSHDNADAIHLRGPHKDVGFSECELSDWGQAIIIGASGPGRFDGRPSGVWIDRCEFTRIFRDGVPVQTRSNYRNKDYRSQTIYASSIDGLSITDCTFTDNGWNAEADPNRTTPSFYSQVIYLGQAAENVTIAGNLIDGAANNAIVSKGRKVDILNNTASRIVNFASLGTNESPEWPFSGTVAGNVATDFLPVNALDDASLSGGRQIEANSGIAVSLVNCAGVTIAGNTWGPPAAVGSATPRRSAAYMISGGVDSSGLFMSDVTIEGDRLVGFDRLAEMRDYKAPAGQSIAFSRIEGVDNSRLLVRNTSPSSRSEASKGVTLDGRPIAVE